MGTSEPGVKTTGVCKGWWEPASKASKGKCQFTVHYVSSPRMPMLKLMKKEQAETSKSVTALHHKAFLLSPLTSPISTPSVSSLTLLWRQTLQTWPMLGWQVSYHLFQSLQKTLICHHQWWTGAAILRIRQYSKWLADPNHITLNQDSMCPVSNTQIWVCSHSHVFIHTCAFTHPLTPMHTSTQSHRFTHFYILVHALIHTRRHACAHTQCPHSSNIWNRLLLGCSGPVRSIVGSNIKKVHVSLWELGLGREVCTVVRNRGKYVQGLLLECIFYSSQSTTFKWLLWLLSIAALTATLTHDIKIFVKVPLL